VGRLHDEVVHVKQQRKRELIQLQAGFHTQVCFYYYTLLPLTLVTNQVSGLYNALAIKRALMHSLC